MVHYTYAPNMIEECVTTCCDHLIVVINSLTELKANYSIASQFYMYLFINTRAGEEPAKLRMNLENFVIFQKVENAPNLFSVFERKNDGIEKIYLWNGESFVDNDNKRHEYLVRSFSGEELRVGSGPMMPWAFIWTLEDGTQIIGSGGYHEYLKVIAEYDNLTLKWTDVYYQEGSIWGTLYKNNSATGLTKLIMEHQVDVAVGMYCGNRLHRRLDCSTVIEYDGYAALLLKPKPLPTWLGLVLPFDMFTWFAILGTVILTALIMGLCLKYNLKSEKVDWTVHFLDAFHPMCGRNMSLPGLNAAHLGRE